MTNAIALTAVSCTLSKREREDGQAFCQREGVRRILVDPHELDLAEFRSNPPDRCYALRAELGLRNSSNRVEKENDLVVAQRQKHNGMSWSTTGSGALAQIAALSINGELHNWLLTNYSSYSSAISNRSA